MDRAGGRERGILGKQHCRTHTIMCETVGSAAWHREPSTVLQMAWGGDGGWAGGKLNRGGIYVYLLLMHTIVQQKLTQHSKAVILRLKN